jgi:predicted GIY-YIG superfamily endonuclease
MKKKQAGRRRRCDRNHILYRLECVVTGELYIGVTGVIGKALKGSLEERFRRHVSKATHEGHSWMLHKRLRRYGPEKWQREIVAVVRGRAAAFQEERRLIRKLSPQLNTF